MRLEPLTGFVGELGDVGDRAFDKRKLRRRSFQPRGWGRAGWKHGGGDWQGRCSNRLPRRDQMRNPTKQLGGIGGHAG